MKEAINDYKEIFMSFLKNKKYLFIILFVAILSYGFAITHYSIGVDDLCFDRYVQGSYILSAKRWGTWALYNLLHIVTFSPFWLDFIVATLMVFAATLICTSMKRILKEKANIWVYIIFAAIFISNPIICQFFIYQSTNLSVVVSNVLAIISAIVVFENLFYIKNKWYHIISGVILIFAISMYEACAQTFLAMIFIFALLKIMVDNVKGKEIIRLIVYGIISLVIGIIGYYVTGKIVLVILDKMNVLMPDYADHTILWIEENFLKLNLEEKIKTINKRMLLPLINGVKNYMPVTILALTTFISICIGILRGIKTKKYIIMPIILGIVLSNFILIVLQVSVMYRIQFSWIIAIAFLCMYIYMETNKKPIIKYVVNILLVLLIIIQTNSLNNLFYNEYKRYEKEKFVANEIAMDIKKCENYQNKLIIYVVYKNVKNPFENYLDNGVFLLLWGTGSFKQYGVETTKFINNFGYDFKVGTIEDYEEVMLRYRNLIEEQQDRNIIELDEFIIVNLSKYLST